MGWVHFGWMLKGDGSAVVLIWYLTDFAKRRALIIHCRLLNLKVSAAREDVSFGHKDEIISVHDSCDHLAFLFIPVRS